MLDRFVDTARPPDAARVDPGRSEQRHEITQAAMIEGTSLRQAPLVGGDGSRTGAGRGPRAQAPPWRSTPCSASVPPQPKPTSTSRLASRWRAQFGCRATQAHPSVLLPDEEFRRVPPTPSARDRRASQRNRHRAG